MTFEVRRISPALTIKLALSQITRAKISEVEST